ncbi:MarR family transcriptional regulator [Azospirillum sp. TSH7]|uniref:MarR family winged helix-turn-helix transcriptional regulator n=1 Tax=unclassified Azospirillum TaxID=2630922 RepID=UPI000D61F407|nr:MULTISPECIES: MarR family transcriptional regulator [unclassified Azospirillum]PWC66028.1 MarR family transcriptional regulator [Azospirillum sp. TSH20]PWC66956.1 MarR family transcriptional regulator [Azospirillum sp. TSH7]
MSAPSENCPPVPHRVPLDDQLCFALYMTSMAITRTYKPMLDAMGITYPQYLILSVLGEADGATVGAIAERLALESSTVTPPVKRLEQAGLVERRRSRMDERQVQVWLTDAGRAMVDESTCLSRTLVERSGMDLAQIGSLNRQVRSLLRALGDWDESASADPAALDAGERP